METTALDVVVERLKAEGWQEQWAGMIYVNGMQATNLLRDGEVLSLQLELTPDEEFVAQAWPGT